MPDIQTRKILFVQEFLSIRNEETISRFENLLKKEKKIHPDKIFVPMTHDELNARIDQAESDFQEGRFVSGSELLKKYTR